MLETSARIALPSLAQIGHAAAASSFEVTCPDDFSV